jgi:hypothetical protein
MSDDPMDIQNLAKAASEQLKGILSQDIIVQQQAHIKKLEAKLAKAMQIIKAYEEDEGYVPRRVVSLYEELSGPMKGQNDE